LTQRSFIDNTDKAWNELLRQATRTAHKVHYICTDTYLSI